MLNPLPLPKPPQWEACVREVKLHGWFPHTRGHVALVSQQDYNGVVQYRWNVTSKGRTRYAQRGIKIYVSEQSRIQKSQWMHRFIMNPSTHLVVHHKNGNGLHNYRSNLEECTQSRNMQLSATGGVQFVKSRKKYRARIKVDGYEVHLGYFKTEEEAQEAVSNARQIRR